MTLEEQAALSFLKSEGFTVIHLIDTKRKRMMKVEKSK